MGNQLDRITHLNYSELPTGDPSGIEQDELRVGVAYFFSDEEEADLDERGGGGGGVPPEATKYSGGKGAGSPAPETPVHHHHQNHHHHHPCTPPWPLQQLLLSEPQFCAFRGPECIFSKAGGVGGAQRVHPASALPALCQAGDLLELLELGAAPGPPHWAVYVGGGQIVHLRGGQIRLDGLPEAGGVAGRVVSDWYRFRPLVAELVVQNARGHLGLARPEICWADSESFAAWCRFGKREFKAGGEGGGAGPRQQQYFLQSRLADGEAHTSRFHSLEDLIREKRRLDASGRLRVLKGLAMVDGKE